jgi:hypothetical protein
MKAIPRKRLNCGTRCLLLHTNVQKSSASRHREAGRNRTALSTANAALRCNRIRPLQPPIRNPASSTNGKSGLTRSYDDLKLQSDPRSKLEQATVQLEALIWCLADAPKALALSSLSDSAGPIAFGLGDNLMVIF